MNVTYQLVSPAPRPGTTKSNAISIILSTMAAGFTYGSKMKHRREDNNDKLGYEVMELAKPKTAKQYSYIFRHTYRINGVPKTNLTNNPSIHRFSSLSW